MERRELDMAFSYAYSLNGSDAPITIDYTISSGTPALGDCLVIASGGTGGKVSNTTAVASKVGVCVGQNFLGLAAGGTYAATTVGVNQPSASAKIIMDPNAVYRIPWGSGVDASTAVIGNTYLLTSATDQTLSLTAGGSTYVPFQLVDSDITAQSKSGSPTGAGYAYVTIQSANRVIQA
jgi:hypothetical protein